jgi:cysteine desulfurase family protein
VTRHYLDNAATSWPKPLAVAAAMNDYMRDSGVSMGRAATRRGAALQQVIDRCRSRAARLLGTSDPQHVVFAFNGTDALNLALHGLLRPGDHVVTTDAEHNSVLRPLRALADRCGIEVTRVGVDAEGVVDPRAVVQALRPSTRLLAITHVSNVTGAIQPLEPILAAARERGVRTLVDAAQSAGHLPLDVAALGIDLLACSGHKGLLGPLGTGLLCIAPGVEAELVSLRQGGTGTRSEDDVQPERLPDRFESGNHNAVGLVGLEAALAWIEERGVAALRSHEQSLTAALLDGLHALPRVSLYGPREVERRTGVVSLTIDGFEPQEAAAILDSQFSVECRAGLHCAPRMHRALGTIQHGGTVRLSLGALSTRDDVDAAVSAVAALAGG